MNAKKLDYFRNKLLQKQGTLIEMVQRTEGYGREKEPDTQDMADMAVESYTREFFFERSSGDRHVLRLVHEALDRIDDKTYGICANCGDLIKPKRLEAVPWTRLCVRCQNLLERGLLDR